MMTYCISDIHGNMEAFNDIMQQINFQEDDELYILGDVIDRHPHGIEILQKIMNMPNVHMILGNHEYMMMQALGFPYEKDPYEDEDGFQIEAVLNWYHNGGDVTHSAWEKLDKDTQESMKEFLKNLPLNYEIEVGDQPFKLVHGTAEEVYDVCKEVIDVPKACFCVWDRDTIMQLDEFTDCKIIFGHTPTCNLQDGDRMSIYENGNITGIDCGAGYDETIGGRLCCLRLDDMKTFYSA